jgi:hypothetical protein
MLLSSSSTHVCHLPTGDVPRLSMESVGAMPF